MNDVNWKRELHRLLEMFQHESTISLRKIKHCFKASGCPFNEDFRQYFHKMATHRFDANFYTVLFEQMKENRLPMTSNADAPIDDDDETVSNVNVFESRSIDDQDDSMNVTENENLIALKIENNFNVPIEMADTDDEGGEEQQMQLANDPIEVDGQMESNGLQRLNNSDENLNGACNGSTVDLNNENGIEVDVKRELKVETETEDEMVDLPLVEFDPNKASHNTEAVTLIVPRPSNSSLNVQNRSKHDGAKSFKCTKCAYASQYKSTLKIHLRVHEPIKPFKCTHCDYACRQNGTLERHKRIHAGQKLMGVARDPKDGLYKCTHCTRQFTKMAHLSNHLTLSHMNNRHLFNCRRCMRRFAHETEKERHEIRCQNRRYECHLCKKYVTTSRTDMRKHLRTHSGAKPFKCATCNKCFRQKNALRYHLDFIHGRKHE